MEPADLHTKHPDTKPELSSGFRGHNHPDPNEHLFRSLWAACLGGLDYIVQYLREIRHESHQRALARKPDQPSVTRHVCTRDGTRTCLCPSSACADDSYTYRRARGPYLYAEHTQHAADIYTCPISGRICLQFECRDWCESGVDRTKT